tara:strand:- start:52 stop:471 length:420 start_codon:yes stop_codon:yes gene_type:complete
MDAKEILDPQKLMITVGVLTVVLSFWGIMNGEQWAEYGWGEENVLAHDADYEKMWALHIMPLGVMAIGTGVFVSGKALAKMSMLAPSVVVIIFVGMGALTGDSGYSSETPPLSVMALPLLTIVLTFVLGIAGYLHKDGE